MKNISLSWASWMVIAAVILNTVGLPLLASSPPLYVRIGHPSASLVESQANVADRLFTKPTSLAQEFSLRGEQQNKQFFLLARVAHIAPYCPTGEEQWRQLLDPDCFSFQLFFPRKIAPPSSSTDPFLA